MKKLFVLALLFPLAAFSQTFPSPTFNSLTLQTPLTAANGGSGVNNGSKTVTLGGNLTTSGAFPLTLTTTASSNVTLPISGTLLTTSGAATTYAPLASPTFTGAVIIPGGTINNATLGATTPNTGSFTTLATNGNITQPSTGNFFSNGGTIIDRINDRILMGGYSFADGAFPPVTVDWFSLYQDSIGYVNASPTVSLSVSPAPTVHGGTVAAAFASQSFYQTSAGPSVIPVEAFAVNNTPTYNSQAWAYYGEAHRETAIAGTTYGMELDTHSLAPDQGSDPYSQGIVVGLQLSSGAGVQSVQYNGTISGTTMTVSGAVAASGYNIAVGSMVQGVGVHAGTVVTALLSGTGGNGTYTVSPSQTIAVAENMIATAQYDASAALQIESNNSKWQTGITFGATSLTGSDGVSGKGVALALAKGHALQWYMPGSLTTASIISTVDVQTDSTGINFTDSGMEVTTNALGPSPAPIAYFQPFSNAVNYLNFAGAATGSPVQISAAGSDTNVNLTLQGQGAGQVTTGSSPFSAPGNDALTYQNTSGQSIPSAAQTTFTGWTKVFDRLNANFNASTGTFTAPVTGIYQVSAGINYSFSTSAAVGDFYEIFVVANGANICAGNEVGQIAAGDFHTANTSCAVSLTAGQTVVIQAFQNSGSAVTTTSGQALNYLSINRVP